MDEFRDICQENLLGDVWDEILIVKEDLQIDDDCNGLKLISHTANSKLRINKGGIVRFSTIKEDVKMEVAIKAREILNREAPSITTQDKYDKNNIAAGTLLIKMIEAETDIKEHFMQMFLIFNQFMMVKNIKLAKDVTEFQREFLDLVNKSNGSIEHLQILIESVKNEYK
jgi:hypothetical protein